MAGKNEFRKGQGILQYGVGAIVDFPEDSLMAAGLDMWPSELADSAFRAQIIEATQIMDSRLIARLNANPERRVKLQRFLSPVDAPPRGGGFAAAHGQPLPSGYMPFVRFPLWHFCPRCRVLWKAQPNTPSNANSLRCQGMVRRTEGNAIPCGQITPDFRKPTLVPVRFAVVCESGHIMDFPWKEWVHSGQSGCNAGSGEIFLVATGGIGGEGIRVECSKCKKKRTLLQAFNKNAFEGIWSSHNTCPGERPWLGPDAKEPGCTAIPKLVQRGASNVHFPKLTSSILIPPYSEMLRQVLDRPDIWGEIQSLPKVDGALPRQFLETKAKNHGLDPEIFCKAVEDKLNGSMQKVESFLSETHYRYTEYKAFLGTRPPAKERRDFDIIPRHISTYKPEFGDYIERVVLVPKLRETRVLLGFTRLIPPDSEDSGQLAPLSLKQKNWLPATEVRGEGIFIELKRAALDAWQKDNPLLVKRVALLNERLKRVCNERRIPQRVITAEFLLTHTLSHLLIRQLSYDCGYDSSSLAERLYVSSEPESKMTGFLIYTASGDSEGTLGGLVRQGEPSRLEQTFSAAIENALMCSSDPLCIESEGQGNYSLNLAACHACGLLPETSCEEGNKLLDRVAVLGTADNPAIGFIGEFSDS